VNAAYPFVKKNVDFNSQARVSAIGAFSTASSEARLRSKSLEEPALSEAKGRSFPRFRVVLLSLDLRVLRSFFKRAKGWRHFKIADGRPH
jgi:hypothetical protein